jgi:hypothetical protein
MAEKLRGTNLKIKLLKITALALMVIFLVTPAKSAQAVSLYLSPSSGLYKVGSSFSVMVYVQSSDQAMNAASGTVYYPADNLELISLSKNGSIFGLWVDEPTFSQAAGTFHFEGIVMNPGYKGSGGRIITANFKVKAAGSASLRFSSGSVLANDGLGTNILDSMGTAQFTLTASTPAPSQPITLPTKVETPKPVSKPATPTVTVPAKSVEPPATPAVTATGLPALPQIFSSTHPNQDSWYNVKQASFNWQVPPDVTAVSLLFGELDNAVPTVIYSPPVAEKTIDNLEDGVWYFSVRFKNKLGWGETAHYRIQVDTTPPDAFAIKFVSDGQEITNLRPVVTFETTDALSKIDHYKIRVIGDAGIEAANETVSSNPYMLPIQSPGKKTIFVQAFDKAGNFAIATADFDVTGFAAPTVTSYPQELTVDQNLLVTGQTEPNSEVTVWLKSKTDNLQLGKTVVSDANGHFVFNYDKGLISGVYKLWVEAKNQQGETSYPSAEYDLKVNPSSFFKISPLTYNILIILAILSSIGFVIVLFGRLGRQAVFFRKKVKYQARRANIAFAYLRNNLKNHISLLESIQAARLLTKEEKTILAKSKRDLADVEMAMKK